MMDHIGISPSWFGEHKVEIPPAEAYRRERQVELEVLTSLLLDHLPFCPLLLHIWMQTSSIIYMQRLCFMSWASET